MCVVVLCRFYLSRCRALLAHVIISIHCSFSSSSCCSALSPLTSSATPGGSSAAPFARHDYTRFWGDALLQHSDFPSGKGGDHGIKTFRLEDYSWESHGYSILARYFADMSPLLDEAFNEAMDITDYTLNDNQNVDTRPLRQAVWYYTLNIKGMKHDDFDYQNVRIIRW